MKFALQADGAAAAGQGIGSLFKAMALGPMYRQKAEDEAMLSAARMGQASASARAQDAAARKYSAEAELLGHKLGLQQDPLKDVLVQNQVPLDKRPLVEQFIQTGSFGPTYETPVDGVGPVPQAPVSPDTMSAIARGISLYNRTIGTGSKVDDMAQAGNLEQLGRDRQAVIGGKLQALPVSQAYFATSGKAPFDNVGETGYTLNNLTGSITAQNPVLANIFGDQQGALATQRRAAANASNASATLSGTRNQRVAQGLDRPVTILDEDTGEPSIVTLPVKGAPNVVGVAVPKKTGTDATNAKTRNQVIAAVEKEMPGATEQEIQDEVNRRLLRRGLTGEGNKNPAPAPGAPKIPVKDAAALEKARAAIASGAPREAVIKRLKDNGIDTTGL